MKTPPIPRAAAAIVICAVGLVADSFVFAYIDQVFPSMTLAQQRLFAGWVAWAYGIGLISGIWPRHLYWVPVD
jgi:predicted MFS family arabinose efflux permease